MSNGRMTHAVSRLFVMNNMYRFIGSDVTYYNLKLIMYNTNLDNKICSPNGTNIGRCLIIHCNSVTVCELNNMFSFDFKMCHIVSCNSVIFQMYFCDSVIKSLGTMDN